MLVETQSTVGTLSSLKDSIAVSHSASIMPATISSSGVPEGSLPFYKLTLESLLSFSELRLHPKFGKLALLATQKFVITVILQSINDIPSHFERPGDSDAGDSYRHNLFGFCLEVMKVNAARSSDIEVLHWLSRAQPWKRHHDIKTQRLIGGGIGCFSEMDFEPSLRANYCSRNLLCHGLPGAGKTFLFSLSSIA